MTNRLKGAAATIKNTDTGNKRSEGVVSVSMSFETCLVASHKNKDTFVENWVDSELKKSSSYFERKIYSES